MRRAESGERVSGSQVRDTIAKAKEPSWEPSYTPDPIERKKLAAGLTHARGMSLATLDQFIIELRQLRREKKRRA